MRKVSSLTKNPTRVTALLSAAALLGYASYRLIFAGAQTESQFANELPEIVPDDLAGTGIESRFANELPEIVLDDLTGSATSLRSWAGTPLLVNFWATWCAPCLREIPMLKEFETANPSIQVVGIAIDYLDPVLEFAKEIEFNYPVLVGQADGMDAAAALGVEVVALPFTVYVAADGAVLGIHSGEIHPEHLENLAATVADLEAGTIDRSAARERLAGLR